VLDIETAPHLVHVWRLWKTDVAPNQVIREGYILCFAAKWLGEKEVFFARVEHDAKGNPTAASRRRMLDLAHKLLSEADAVVHYNGIAFDIPWFNAEFLHFGYKPPAPFDQIDLLLALRKRANFASNRLAQIAQRLEVGAKVKHEGHELWKKCMADDPTAWVRMQRYNEGDVRLTERLYKRIIGWLPGHPNQGKFNADGRPVCCNCGSPRLKSNGIRRTALQSYRRYLCLKCGAWNRDNHKLVPPVARRPA
jgi:hypothetical protein